MADVDKDSKTEEPTGKRVSEEFKKGNFAQAQEISIAFTLFAGLLVVGIYGERIASSVFEIARSLLGNLGGFDLNYDGFSVWAVEALGALGKLCGPFMLFAMIAAVIAGGLQSGFKLTPKALEPKWNKLDPIAGAKRLVSKETLVRFGIDLLKLGAVAAVLYMCVQKIVEDPIFYAPIDIAHVGTFISDTMLYIFYRILIALVVIAAISYFYQKRKVHEGLKMTKDEVKHERKDQDMSPELKSARMRMALRLMQRQMLSEVPTADVVVTNPTHYAVALKYERGVDSAPMVLAKGENAFAQRIKAVAAEHGVPVVENKMVARMLYKVSKVGSPIPMEMFQSVAEILAFVYRTHKYYFHKLKSRRAAARKNR